MRGLENWDVSHLPRLSCHLFSWNTWSCLMWLFFRWSSTMPAPSAVSASITYGVNRRLQTLLVFDSGSHFAFQVFSLLFFRTSLSYLAGGDLGNTVQSLDTCKSMGVIGPYGQNQLAHWPYQVKHCMLMQVQTTSPSGQSLTLQSAPQDFVRPANW